MSRSIECGKLDDKKLRLVLRIPHTRDLLIRNIHVAFSKIQKLVTLRDRILV